MAWTDRARVGGRVVVDYAATAAYGATHPEARRTGTRGDEDTRPLPGDELVPQPHWSVTLAESADAPPERVWPWLVQMGHGRGGYYGDLPRWRDRGDRAGGAAAVLEEFQDLGPGDVLLDGPGCTPAAGAWAVWQVDPPRSLVLFSSRTPLAAREVGFLPRVPRSYFHCSWAFVVLPDAGGSRLLVRTRARTVPGWLIHAMAVLRAGDPVVQRALLDGIRRRAEGQPAGVAASRPG